MLLKKLLVSVYLIFFIILYSFAQIKVACVGDSITFGFTILNHEEKSYPARLNRLLSEDWTVENFGVIGATMLKNGDIPYWKQKAFIDSKNFNPDVVIIMLGTNDTKPQNWKFKNEYIADYTVMINEFRALSSKPYIFICLPVPALTKIWGISDSIIREEIIPMIKLLGKKNNVPVIDLYQPLSNHKEWFTDKIHPNAAGTEEMAKLINSELLKKMKKINNRKK
jgi:acyl-CoA thioesterase I